MAKVTKMQEQQAKAISTAIVASFFDGKDAEQINTKVSSVEMPRVKWLFSFFPQSDLTDVQDATKGYRKVAKDTHGDKSPQYRTAQQRTKEVAALYGAWRFAELKEPVGGYHETVKTAYEALKKHQIRANGSKVPEKWERDVNTQAKAEAAVFKAKEVARRKAEQAGKELSAEEAEKVEQQERDSIAREGANDLATRLYQSKIKALGAERGVLFCQHVMEALETLIAAGVDAAKDAEKEQKAA